MQKIIVIILVAAFGVMSVSAIACPKGTHPHGGTGSHHAGGTCY
ncbi:hypothetical protein RZO85_02185 [Raoultella ornithinolytica]|nr:hypothetical protein [Raoultella ornithinolytica]MDV0598540.1 hypothetical protein [Raoultella ornithinolytica]